MAKDRTAGRIGGRKGRRAAGPDGAAGRPDGRRKLTVYLPADLIRQLKHMAIDEDKDLGELAGPKLRELVGQRYQIHRRAEPAAGPLGVVGTAESAERNREGVSATDGPPARDGRAPAGDGEAA